MALQVRGALAAGGPVQTLLASPSRPTREGKPVKGPHAEGFPPGTMAGDPAWWYGPGKVECICDDTDLLAPR